MAKKNWKVGLGVAALAVLCGCSSATREESREPVGSVASPLNIPDSLTLTTQAAIDMRRTSLINFIWGQGTLPTTQAAVQATTEVCQTSGLPNLASTTQLRAAMPNSKEAFACHLRPTQSNGRLVILHHGHGCKLADGSGDFDDNAYGMYRTAQHLLSDGFGVLYVHMPYFRPGDCAGNATSAADGTPLGGSTNPHPALVAVVPSTGSSLQFFLGGVLQALNKVASLNLYQEYNMVGLSGGGWTTTWYAALDPRIKTSFVMSGAMPFQFWIGPGNDEQDNAGYYNGRTGYKDLFLMATDQGRRQVHVLRRHDGCCFNQSWNLASGNWADNVHAYETDIRTIEAGIPGSGTFRLEIDETAPTPASHTISRYGVTGVILAELEGSRRYIGADATAEAFARGANGHLWRKPSAGAWSDTGLHMVGAPTVLHIAGVNQHTVDVFFRNRDNELTWAFPNGGSWTTQVVVGSRLLGDPTAVSRGPNLWDVAAFGSNYIPYWLTSTNFAAGFQNTVPTVSGIGTPSLVGNSTTTNELNLYFRGLGEGAYLVSWNGASWSFDSAMQPGVILGFPAAAQAGSAKRVFVYGKDSQLYVNTKSAGTWSDWSSVSAASGSTGTLLRGSPSTALTGNGVTARTATGSLSEFVLSGSTWTVSNLGGTFVGTPTYTTTGIWVRTSASTLWRNSLSVWASHGGWFE